MDRFLQLHLLTVYPPSNLNRDDLGRPKTAILGGKQRLRISSQSLKRAWRTSDVFKQALSNGTKEEIPLSEEFMEGLGNPDLSPHLGVRTKDIGIAIYNVLIARGVNEKNAQTWAKTIAEKFGDAESEDKLKKDKEDEYKPLKHLQLKQPNLFSMDELAQMDQLSQRLAKEKRPPTDDELGVLRDDHRMVDIAMFGRMLAHKNNYIREEAAVQVAHAVTVHEVQIENDFFTAVDDLNLSAKTGKPGEDAGAAFVGDFEFGAGLFYLYVCVDREDLLLNLQDDRDLWERSLRALTKATATVAPTGKQNSFASRAIANFILAERGNTSPRSLTAAFLKPVGAGDPLHDAIEVLRTTRINMNKVYGINEATIEVNANTGEGSFDALLKFVVAEGGTNQ